MQHLSSRQLFITNPSRSVGLKKSADLIFKFPGQFHDFRNLGTKYQTPGLSRTIQDIWHDIIFDWSKLKADDNINVNEKFKFIPGMVE